MLIKIFLRLYLCAHNYLVTSNLLVDSNVALYEILLLSAASVLFATLLSILLCIPLRHISANGVQYFMHLLEIIVVVVFVTTVFSPSKFGPLDGTEGIRKFTTTQYAQDSAKSILVIIISSLLFFRALQKKLPLLKGIITTSAIITIVLGMIHTSDKERMQNIGAWDFLGRRKNIIVIIADGLQGSITDSVFQESVDLQERYQDFSFFNKAISPHVYTSFAFPALVSGTTKYHDSESATSKILKLAKLDNFMLSAQKMGFETYEFPYSKGFSCGANKPYRVINPKSWSNLRSMLLAATARNIPLLISRKIFITGSQSKYFSSVKETSLSFLMNITNNIAIGSHDRSLIFHHSMLPHAPIMYGKNGEHLENETFTAEKVKNEAYFLLDKYSDMFQSIKANKLWDSSLIIVSADHGSLYRIPNDALSFKGSSYYQVGAYNPCILIKYPYQSGKLSVDSQAISTTDIRFIIEKYLDREDWRGGKAEINPSIPTNHTVYATTYLDKQSGGYYNSMKSYEKISLSGNIDNLHEVFANDLHK